MSDRSSPTFVLIPGAGGSATYWYRLVEELSQRGREAIAVDLPAADDSAGLAEYADAVVAAIGDRNRIVLVAQSMGGFTAPLVCERVPVEVDGAFTGPGYGIPSAASEEAIELAARREALFLDPTYTAKAMAGLVAYVRRGAFSEKDTVLFWHTGGQVGLFA